MLKLGQWKWLVVLALLITSMATNADNPGLKKTLVITDSLDGPEQKLHQALSTELGGKRELQVTHYSPELDVQKLLGTHSPSEVITIGSASLAVLDKLPDHTPTLSLLTLKEKFSNAIKGKATNRSVIYLEQPLDRISRSLTNNFRSIKTCAVLTEKPAKNKIQKINGITVNFYDISDQSHLITKLRSISAENDAIIALPNPHIYNSLTIKNILVTTYKAQTPIIGYSANFTKAGALMSLHTPIEALSKDALNWVKGGAVVVRKPSDFYMQTFNENVARSLRIKPSSTAVFNELLQEGKR